jgi:hypothetical protein
MVERMATRIEGSVPNPWVRVALNVSMTSRPTRTAGARAGAEVCVAWW